MYKKISHNIVEEHFDHPAILPEHLHKAGQFHAGFTPALPGAVMTEQTMLFRMDSRTLWTRYSLGMVNFSVSDLGKLSSTSKVEASIYRNAAAIGTSFVPFYGLNSGTKIGESLAVICKNGVKIVEVLRTNGPTADVAVYQDIWNRQSVSIAEYFNELNPSQYPKDLLSEQFQNLTKFWLEDFIARAAGDFAADAIALDNILKVAVTGIPDHTKAGYSSISDVLSRGVIAQFPLLFLE